MAIDYSIVVCTYNPEEEIFKRCLEAIYRLDVSAISTEVIIVDNNSSYPVAELPYVKDYLQKIPASKIIVEKEQGERYARMLGIEESKGTYIVYFDTDNEPSPDYLQNLKKLNAQYPDVAAWGPGNVSVDFLDGVDAAIEEYAKGAFQERHEKETRFASEREWQSCYPFGTGLCTLAVFAKRICNAGKAGRFNASRPEGQSIEQRGGHANGIAMH